MLKLVDIVFSKWELHVAPPEEFAGTQEEVRSRITTDDPEILAAILEEAERIALEPEDRAQSAERRATTLQGAASIAATISIAGVGLVFSSGSELSLLSTVVLGAILLAVIYCLTATAYRAIQASLEIHQWQYPRAEDVLTWSDRDIWEVRAERAATLLWCFGRNTKVADYKIAYLRVASRWFARGLISLLALVAVVSVLAISSDRDGSESPDFTLCSSSTATQSVLKRAATVVPVYNVSEECFVLRPAFRD